jgi:hypothetical protein
VRQHPRIKRLTPIPNGAADLYIWWATASASRNFKELSRNPQVLGRFTGGEVWGMFGHGCYNSVDGDEARVDTRGQDKNRQLISRVARFSCH